MVKPEKYFFALVHAESSLCGGPRVKSDVSELAPQDYVYALLAEIWRSCKCHLYRSRRISCCSLGNPSNKCDTDAAEGMGAGGAPKPSAAPDSCQHRWRQASRTHNQCGGSRPASERFRQPYAVTGSRCTIISRNVEAKATEHALL